MSRRTSISWVTWVEFLRNFCLFDGFLRKGGCYTLLSTAISECLFSDESLFPKIVFMLLSHGLSINVFFLSPFKFVFFQIFLVINSIFFPFNLSVFCHLSTCLQFPSSTCSLLDTVNAGYNQLDKAHDMSWVTYFANTCEQQLRKHFKRKSFSMYPKKSWRWSRTSQVTINQTQAKTLPQGIPKQDGERRRKK